MDRNDNEYMPSALLPSSDVLVMSNDSVLMPAHSARLIGNCKTYLQAPELFNGATKDAPLVLHTPYNDFSGHVVRDFLSCCYAPGGELMDVAFKPDVVKLMHVLDSPILESVKKQLLAHVTTSSIAETEAMMKIASICNWRDVRGECAHHLVEMLEMPYPMPEAHRVRLAEEDEYDHTLAAHATDMCPELMLGVSDLDAQVLATRISQCAPDVIADVIKTMAISARFLTLQELPGYEHFRFVKPSSIVRNVMQRDDPYIKIVATCQQKYGNFVLATHRQPLSAYLYHEDRPEMTAVFTFHKDDFVDGVLCSEVLPYSQNGNAIRFSVRAEIQGSVVTASPCVVSATPVKVDHTISNTKMSHNTTRAFGPGVFSSNAMMLFSIESFVEPRFVIVLTIHGVYAFDPAAV